MDERKRGGSEGENFSIKEKKVKKTLTPEQQVGERIDEIGAENVTQEQEQEMMSQLFRANPRKDGLEINSLTFRLLANPTPRGNFLPEHDQRFLPTDYKSRKAILKYPQAVLPSLNKRSPEDVKLVFDEVERQKKDNYFRRLSNKFEFTGAVVADLRHDLIGSLEQDLENGQPVLLRALWRAGKTSILFKLREKYGRENTIEQDLVGHQITHEEKGLEELQKVLIVLDIAQFILQQESTSGERPDYDAIWKLSQEIQESGINPPEYLKNYLDRTGKTATVLLDEVTSFIPRPDQLEYVAHAFVHPKIKLAIALHYFPSHEELFSQVFKNFKSHSVRPLTTEEIATVAKKPIEGSPIRFTKEFIAKLEDITGGRPWEAVYICGSMLSGEIYSKQKLIYRKEDLDRLMSFSSQQLMSGEGMGHVLFIRNIYDFYRSIYTVMNPEQRAFVNRTAKSNGLSIAEADQQIAQYLTDATIISKDEQQGIYKINGELFKKAILEGAAKELPQRPY